jgi:hypothetical protein
MVTCPNCGGSKLRKNGHNKYGQQKYYCLDCDTYIDKKDDVMVKKTNINIEQDLENREHPNTEGGEREVQDIISEDGLVREIVSNRITTKEEILEYCKVDQNLWEVKEYIVNQWPSTSFETTETYYPGERKKVSKKTPVSFKNIQVKVKLEKKVDIAEWEQFRASFIEDVSKKSINVPKIHFTPVHSDYLRHMVELNLYDLHIGKLGWNPETGDGHYDNKIVQQRFYHALEDLITKTSGYKIEQFLIPWGHDLFNSDIEGTGDAKTARGTMQHNDVRWQKMWATGRDISLYMIERLKKIAPVKVVVVPGNHDTQKMFYLGDLLYCVYKNDKNVEVDIEPTQRKYHRYGNNLIGMTHQIGGKDAPTEERLLALMPAERASRYDFAETEFHEWHVGHLHHKRRKRQFDEQDHMGITIRYMRSLSNADAWHANSGFVGATKGAEALVYNYKTGHAAEHMHNIIRELDAVPVN